MFGFDSLLILSVFLCLIILYLLVISRGGPEVSDCLVNRGSLEPFLGPGRPGRLPGRMELKWGPKGKPNESQMEPKSADPSGLCVRSSERFTSPPTPPPPWPPGAALQKPLFFLRFSSENALNAYAEGSSGGPRGGGPRAHFGIHYCSLGLFGLPLGAPLGVKHKKTLFFPRISRENASSGVPSGPWGCP